VPLAVGYTPRLPGVSAEIWGMIDEWVTLRRAPLAAATLLLIHSVGFGMAHAGDFFVDCGAGNDSESGQSPATAWDSLDPVNSATLAAGDRILFRRGSECSGSLRPQGSGQPGNPIRLAAYGTGPLPIIRALPFDDATILLSDQEYWEIENLEVIGGQTFGIHITGVQPGTLRGFRIIDTVVRDVTGVPTNKESGLVIVSPGSADTLFDDVVIDGVEAHHSTQWAGILVGGDDFGYMPTSPRSSNVTVRNSLVHHVAGDGIALYQVNHGLLEKNVVYDTGLAPDTSVGTPNGIWTWMCHDCTVQFNEGYRTHSPGVDGGVFDIDYGCSDNVVQYNYAHDADGYCVSVFGAYWPTTNSVVRYNVCANNAKDPSKAFQGDIYVLTWGGGTIEGLEVYNNTVLWDPAASAFAVNIQGQIGGAAGNVALFKNNIVVSTVPFITKLDPRVDIEIDNNLYWHTGTMPTRWGYGAEFLTPFDQWQALGYDGDGVFADPQWWSPTGGSSAAFRLTDESPAIDAGAVIASDSSAHPTQPPPVVGATRDIGAYEWKPGLPRSGIPSRERPKRRDR